MSSLKLMTKRLGMEFPNYQEANGDNAIPLVGYTQQQRMIRDKRRSLDRAILYSYQGALVQKIYDPLNNDFNLLEDGTERTFDRALINSNKLKPDYDDKILSIRFESGFKCGDVFEWVNTGTTWLIYSQNLTETAYFRGDIRRCSYILKYLDEDGNLKSSYAAVRGPVETRINHWTKNGVEYNSPNFSLNLIIPKNEDTIKYFQRYAKFYLSNGVENVCWRVEAVDPYRLEGVIEINAVEYYANSMKDDIEKGIVDGQPVPQGEIINPRMFAAVAPKSALQAGSIIGESTIKAKRTYTYSYEGPQVENGEWTTDLKGPLVMKPIVDEEQRPCVQIKWNQTYGETFNLQYGNCKKKITIESLF